MSITRMSTEGRAVRDNDGLSVLWVSEWAGTLLMFHEITVLEKRAGGWKTRLRETYTSDDVARKRFETLAEGAAFDALVV